MIPKIIHYCWMSEDPYPEKIQKCIDSWKRVMPDYEIKLWSYKNFPRGKSKWVDDAFDAGMYAFVADYIRNYALYTEGGVYLDSDVEVIKPFDNLLQLPYFFGKESSSDNIEAAVIGAEKGYHLFNKVLDHYNGTSFCNNDGSFNIITMPELYTKTIKRNGWKFRRIKELSEHETDSKIVCMFPDDFFSPKDYRTGLLRVTDNTYSIHHFTASWVSHKSLDFRLYKIKLALIKIFGENAIMSIASFLKPLKNN